MKVKALELPTREAEQRVSRAQRGAEREELLAQLEELAAWYRDLVVVAVGAERAAVHVDRLADLRDDATRERMLGAERAAEAVRETWRQLEEFNLAPQLALEALFVRLARELAAEAHHHLRAAMPQVPVVEAPGSSRSRLSPLRNAFGGHVIGSTARLRRFTSGSQSPVNNIRYRVDSHQPHSVNSTSRPRGRAA